MLIKVYTVIASTGNDEFRRTVIAASPFDEAVTYLVSTCISTHGCTQVHLFEGDDIITTLTGALSCQWDKLVLHWRSDEYPVYFLGHIKKLEAEA